MVDTLIAVLLPDAEDAICAGSGKLKPLPAVAISFGTETATTPGCNIDGSRNNDTETPPLLPPPAVTEVPLLLLPLEEESAPADT